MPNVQSETKRNIINFLLRYGLVVVNCVFVYWRIEKIKKAENDSKIFSESANLTVMTLNMVLNVLFTVATHVKNMNLLKISLIGNIASVTVFTVYSLCMFWYYSCSLYYQYKVSVEWILLKPLLENLGAVASGASIAILISYAMILLCSEIKELDLKTYIFRFENTNTEATCTMECDEQYKAENETEGDHEAENKMDGQYKAENNIDGQHEATQKAEGKFETENKTEEEYKAVNKTDGEYETVNKTNGNYKAEIKIAGKNIKQRETES